MHPTIRLLLSFPVGLTVGILIISTIRIYAPFHPPEGIDYTSGSPMNAWVAQLPVQSFYFELMAYYVAAFFAGFVTDWVARPSGYTPALFVGFFLILYSIVTFLVFPNPTWMTFAACIGIMLFAALGGYLVKKRVLV